jgi:hypothetical protein
MSAFGAILLSRQPLRPSGASAWVKQSLRAVRWLHDRQTGLVSSIGMQTWELLTTLASDLHMPLLLVIPACSRDDFWRECDQAMTDFNLKPDLTEFLPALAGSDPGRTDYLQERDRLVMEKADILLPLSLRLNGNMVNLLAEAESAVHKVDRQFEIGCPGRASALKYNLKGRLLNPALGEAVGKYLIHWTRATRGPWPGERKISLYRVVVQSTRWPRSAFDTLKRIASMRKIVASSRHMPDRTPTVSFSGLAPQEVVPLMRWRARYGEMSFEPYGIGIERCLAAELGIREVHYCDGRSGHRVPADDRWCWQSRGKITDWRAEQEYRHRGDLKLDGIPPESIALFCMTATEAEELRSQHHGPVWSILA